MLDFADNMTDIYSETLDEGELKTLTFPNIGKPKAKVSIMSY